MVPPGPCPPVGNPGIGVRSTFAAPARNVPDGFKSPGAGTVPVIVVHAVKIGRVRTETVIVHVALLRMSSDTVLLRDILIKAVIGRMGRVDQGRFRDPLDLGRWRIAHQASVWIIESHHPPTVWIHRAAEQHITVIPFQPVDSLVRNDQLGLDSSVLRLGAEIAMITRGTP